jgi:hypothetical protein
MRDLQPSADTRPPQGGAPAVIGWYEHVDLPEWGIRGIRAKIDTGARTSALHVDGVRKLKGGHVRFDVVLNRKRRKARVTVEAPVRRRSRVTSSTGHYRLRYVVPLRIRLGGIEKTIEVGLVARERMRFRMLLGRSAFAGEFLIDASRRCLLGRRKMTRRAPKSRPAKRRAASAGSAA